MKEDTLWAGLYQIGNNDENERQKSVLRDEVDDLNIIILLCKKKKDVAHVQNAGFIICGNYLCYQYPDSPIVNILPLKEVDWVPEVLEKNIFQRSFNKILNTNSVGAIKNGAEESAKMNSFEDF